MIYLISTILVCFVLFVAITRNKFGRMKRDANTDIAVTKQVLEILFKNDKNISERVRLIEKYLDVEYQPKSEQPAKLVKKKK